MAEGSIKKGNIKLQNALLEKNSQEKKFKEPKKCLTWGLIENAVLKKVLEKSPKSLLIRYNFLQEI